MDVQEYPHMLYKDGQIGEDWRIVADAAEEKAAAKSGYVRCDKPAKAKASA